MSQDNVSIKLSWGQHEKWGHWLTYFISVHTWIILNTNIDKIIIKWIWGTGNVLVLDFWIYLRPAIYPSSCIQHWNSVKKHFLTVFFSINFYWSVIVFTLLCSFLWVHAKWLQSCPILWDPMDCSPPGSSVHGILQVWILKWVAMPFSRGSSWPRFWTQVSYVSCTGRRVLYH